MPATCVSSAPVLPYNPRFYASSRSPWPKLASVAEQPAYSSEHAYFAPVTVDDIPVGAAQRCLSSATLPCSAAAVDGAPRIRPLLRPMSSHTLQTMPSLAAAPPPAPDSPPDLTDSKSSKSSSLQSPSLSDLPGPHDSVHFEEITLDDVKTPARYDTYPAALDSRDSGKPFAPRSPMAPHPPRSATLPNVAQMPVRDLTNASKPRLPGLQTQPNGYAKDNSSTLSLPTRRSMRRGLTSPSTPSLTPGRQSRSPSPNTAPRSPLRSPASKRYTAPPSPTLRSGPLDFKPGLMPTVRRQSWQPGRKTVEELEAEYHDSDEDLPDDAVMWNVPMSPRPPHQRASRSPSFSSVAESVPEAKHHDDAPPRSPARSSAGSSYAASTHSSIPEESELTISRTKSWSDALTDLSPEARDLTEALEEYAGETERKIEERIQNGAASARPSMEKKSSPSMIALPPVQKGNIMIDPLPISKEKEKVLSRTRPSWLPPKSQKEERKHLREYQKMMAAAQEAEKRMAAKLQEKQQQRDTTHTSISRIWDQHVLPNWDQVINEPRTRELWWRGVTPRSRGTVWKRAIGNELGLSETGYKAALERAKKLDKKLAKLDPESRNNARESVWFESIRRDTNEAYPELKIFQIGGPLHETLLDVLMAYAMYRADVGYIYGTHLIAGLLILNLSPSDAFIALANILNRPLPMAFLVNDTNAMRRAHDLVLKTLHYKIPKLHYHLTETLNLEPEAYLDPLFRTVFCHGAGLDIASRIWDVYVFEGDKALVRAAVGVLTALEGRLYGSREEVLEFLGWTPKKEWEIKDEDTFMVGVRNAGKVDSASNGAVSPGGAR